MTGSKTDATLRKVFLTLKIASDIYKDTYTLGMSTKYSLSYCRSRSSPWGQRNSQTVPRWTRNPFGTCVSRCRSLTVDLFYGSLELLAVTRRILLNFYGLNNLLSKSGAKAPIELALFNGLALVELLFWFTDSNFNLHQASFTIHFCRHDCQAFCCQLAG